MVEVKLSSEGLGEPPIDLDGYKGVVLVDYFSIKDVEFISHLLYSAVALDPKVLHDHLEIIC
ncbi:MAG: hypothetical protein A4E30_01550 [Methanomassiliicoccales archaeon PtaB.Bin215]|nr:MAG: hypothetical protein A4E30_01550 [Methanomassiliicoccales archaeon PtaB.Bin215]